MKIGFTGTLRGMSKNQKKKFSWTMRQLREFAIEFHHGWAEGSDKEAEAIVKERWPWIDIQRHPAGDRPLQRDKEIVAAVDLLIAAPRTDTEVLRSGTWATIRYARKKGIPIVMLPRL